MLECLVAALKLLAPDKVKLFQSVSLIIRRVEGKPDMETY